MKTALAGMETEVDRTPNPFSPLLKNNHDLLTTAFNSQDSRFSCSNRLLKVGIRTGFNLVQESMDRLQCSRESVRNTMLKHEETFKQQVHELHRLYRVQRMLMAELMSKQVKLHSLEAAASPAVVTDARARFWGSTSTSETSHSSYIGNKDHPPAQLNSELSSQYRYSKTEGPSSRELSISSEDPRRTHNGFNLELPADEDTGTGTGAGQDEATALRKHSKKAIRTEGPDLWADGESEVELTLSIGCGSNRKKPKQGIDQRGIGLGCSNQPAPSEAGQLLLSTPLRLERGEECGEPSAGFDREGLQRPHWLLQALSLNRT